MTEQGKENAGKLSLTKHSRTACRNQQALCHSPCKCRKGFPVGNPPPSLRPAVRFGDVASKAAQTL